ncbi:MAG: MBL fold metallo-hydrolase [Eubacteriales bacterium]|nr:MBL fold metallo-hydrolase [Eubacteriales bacterium]
MKLTFIGADHEVTGSQHLIETSDVKILIDCGMEQGKNVYENAPLPVSYKEIDYLLLTHAHIDHSGMIPYAYVEGFNGTILATEASRDLDSIMLLDSAHIQETEAEYANRKAKRAGREQIKPAYTVEDAQKVLELFRTVPYGEIVELSDTVKIRFVDAGHLLGSASIEMWINEDGVEKKVIFSGDIGNQNKPIIKNPTYITEGADYVLMESTYGARLHEKGINHLEDLRRIIQEALDRGGNAVFPSFAVGRTQELLYLIKQLKDNHMISGHEGFPVYVDSPLAVEATNVFMKAPYECFDEMTLELIKSGVNPISFPGLTLSVSTEDSTAINFNPEPKVILAAAGMCNAGRIRHHLKHNLWRPECSVVFAGYQAEGTLGRTLQDGAESVHLFGEEIRVAAHIETMKDMSSHADQAELIKWAEAIGKVSGRFFLVHGEDESMEVLSGLLKEATGNTVDAPFSGSVFDLAKNEWITVTEGIPYKKPEATPEKTRNVKVNDELSAALDILTRQVELAKQGANADKRKFAAELLRLAKKYGYDI